MGQETIVTQTTWRPRQKGTKGLTQKYGDRLIYVRYKYDQSTGRRYTTVELIEEKTTPPSDPQAKRMFQPSFSNPRTRPPGRILGDGTTRPGQGGGRPLAATTSGLGNTRRRCGQARAGSEDGWKCFSAPRGQARAWPVVADGYLHLGTCS